MEKNIRKLGRGIQGNKVNLTLTNSELDWLESLMNNNSGPVGDYNTNEYIKSRIQKAREVQ